jgi:predicted dehydrogenase
VKVGIIGAGLQGKRRASVFPTKEGSRVEAVACGHPNDLKSARELAAATGAKAYANWQDVVSDPNIDAVIVCTPPHLHAELSIASMEAGKHVLCEKPLARTIDEAMGMVRTTRETEKVLKCGFNHRHHPAILQAKKWADSGLLGDLDFARCRYGMCGRAGYEKEWRANPKLVGGGQLMEQGIHGIDLFRWFLGPLNEVTAFVGTMYWKIDPLEDNAFVLLRSSDGKVGDLHSSLMLWKNNFSLEISGHEGYASVDGIGGSYGVEKAVLGRRDFDKPFAEQIIEYRGQDQSWKEEWTEFEAAIQEGREPIGSAQDGLEAMRLVQAAYESNRTGSAVRLSKVQM